jgi:thiamine-phosphate pyrophosphorylase
MDVDYGVYLVTQGDLAGDRSTVDVVEAAAEHLGLVQLREKHRSARARYELGLELRAVTREHDLALVVNDRIDLAAAVDADGVHLGDDDLPVAVARDRLGPDALVGRSVATVAGAREAAAAGADYLGLGALYRTDTKPDADAEGLGPERVRAVTEAVSVPVVGIGGVTAATAADVVAAGADGVAVVSAIVAADDPAAAARELRAAVERGRARRTAGEGDGA